jgi:hypothetical protein
VSQAFEFLRVLPAVLIPQTAVRAENLRETVDDPSTIPPRGLATPT